VLVREVRWEDFPDLLENYYALYDEVKTVPDLGISLYEQRPSYSNEVQWFATLVRKIESGEAISLVAEEEGRVVGSCTVSERSPTESKHVGVLGIHVARAFRDRGIGRALMTAMIERCRVRFEILELSVFRVNARARALYISLGFEPYGVVPRAVLRGGRYIDVEHMVLELGGPKGGGPTVDSSVPAPSSP
jgi:RimJ/RimL family protein N-acetyltransferase